MSTFNTLASGTTITGTLSSATFVRSYTYNPVSRADVSNELVREGQSASVAQANGRVPSNHVTNPGVFTEGTVREGTLSYTSLDSNS